MLDSLYYFFEKVTSFTSRKSINSYLTIVASAIRKKDGELRK